MLKIILVYASLIGFLRKVEDSVFLERFLFAVEFTKIRLKYGYETSTFSIARAAWLRGTASVCHSQNFAVLVVRIQPNLAEFCGGAFLMGFCTYFSQKLKRGCS